MGLLSFQDNSVFYFAFWEYLYFLDEQHNLMGGRGCCFCVFWLHSDVSSSSENHKDERANKTAQKKKKNKLEGFCIPFHSWCRAPAQALAWIKESLSEQHRLTSSLRTLTITHTHTLAHTHPRENVAPTADWSVFGFFCASRLHVLKKENPRTQRVGSVFVCVCVCVCVRFFPFAWLPPVDRKQSSGCLTWYNRWHIFQSPLHVSPVYVWRRVHRKCLERRSKTSIFGAKSNISGTLASRGL